MFNKICEIVDEYKDWLNLMLPETEDFTAFSLVAMDGVEPSRPKARHFECRVSTNSTTSP